MRSTNVLLGAAVARTLVFVLLVPVKGSIACRRFTRLTSIYVDESDNSLYETIDAMTQRIESVWGDVFDQRRESMRLPKHDRMPINYTKKGGDYEFM